MITFSTLTASCSSQVCARHICLLLPFNHLINKTRYLCLKGHVHTKLDSPSGEDPGFFLGGGALVSCSTSFFFLQDTSCIRKPQVISRGGGGAHPLHPPPRSASGSCAKTQTVLKRVLLTRKNGYFSTIFVTEQSCPPRQYLNYIRAFYISDGFLYLTLVQRDQIFGP